MDEELVTKVVQAVIKESAREKKMTLQLAEALIKKVEVQAKHMGVPVVIAVSDAAARPVAIHCMDGAYIGSYDIALNKTFTSVGFKMSTEQLGKLSQPGQSLYGIQFTNGGKVVILGGGEPLMSGDTMIGAVGISGGTASQDTALAVIAKKIFEMEVILCK